jgi:hypothetical protein
MSSELPHGTTAYVIVPLAACYARAVHSYDGVIARLPYGQTVSVGGASGRFWRVTAGSVAGWVLKDACTTVRTLVYPELTTGVVYSAIHSETEAIRRLLEDAFAAAELALPLQPEEFVTYRLRLSQQRISWGSERPRIAGTWHTLLRGRPSIHVGVTPRTHAVMEWLSSEGEGQLAYVESVTPDETLLISYVVGGSAGLYQQEVVSPGRWREWRPVWITVT